MRPTSSYLVGEAEVDHLVHAGADNRNLAVHDGAHCHPLFAAGSSIVQTLVVLDQLLCGAFFGGHAGIQVLTGHTLQGIVCGGDGQRVNQGRSKVLGLIALILEHLAADQRMHEGSHAAVSLHNVDVHALGGKGLDVGEIVVQEESAHRGSGAHDLGQTPRLIDADFVSHSCCYLLLTSGRCPDCAEQLQRLLLLRPQAVPDRRRKTHPSDRWALPRLPLRCLR